MVIAIFDASGFSMHADRWTLSFRICFFEIAVSARTALEIREECVATLDTAWTQLMHSPRGEDTWAHALDSGPQLIDGQSRSFWSSVVDDQPFRTGAQHCLIFCDATAGHKKALLPEARPLLPRGLYCVAINDKFVASLTQMSDSEIQDIDEVDWAALGSLWTDDVPLVHCRLDGMRHTTAAEPSIGRQTAYPGWSEFRTAEGHQYFHHSMSKQTVWELPIEVTSADRCWIEYLDDRGRTYYHNRNLNQTQWLLPPGAHLVANT